MSDLIRFPNNRKQRLDNLYEIASQMGIPSGLWEIAKMAPLDKYSVDNLQKNIETLKLMLQRTRQRLQNVKKRVEGFHIVPESVKLEIQDLEEEIITITYQMQLKQAHLIMKENNIEEERIEEDWGNLEDTDNYEED